MKHSPSLILRYDGLHHLVAAYKQCYQKNPKFYLINPKTKSCIHWSHFIEFINQLSQGETDRMGDIYKIRLIRELRFRNYVGIIVAVKHKAFYEIKIDSLRKLCNKKGVIYDLKYVFKKIHRIIS